MQAYELPSQAILWVIMRDLSKDYELKKDAVLLNHLSRSVLVTFRTERQAKLVFDFLSRKKVFFKAPRVRVPCITSQQQGRLLHLPVNVRTTLAPHGHCCLILRGVKRVCQGLQLPPTTPCLDPAGSMVLSAC